MSWNDARVRALHTLLQEGATVTIRMDDDDPDTITFTRDVPVIRIAAYQGEERTGLLVWTHDAQRRPFFFSFPVSFTVEFGASA